MTIFKQKSESEQREEQRDAWQARLHELFENLRDTKMRVSVATDDVEDLRRQLGDSVTEQQEATTRWQELVQQL